MEGIGTLSRSISARTMAERENKSDFQLCRILTLAARRASGAVVFFEERGARAEDVVSRGFYSYMGVKKDAQRVIIDKIARSQGIELTPLSTRQNVDEQLGAMEIGEDFENIFRTVHEVAADELEFYLHYATVEKDIQINSILLMLADLAKEFLFDVKIWYLNHKETSSVVRADFYEAVT